MTATLKRIAAEQRGFSMVAVLGLLLISSLFAVAAFQAANTDIPVSQKDLDSHRAYAAAQAGINYYLYHLYQNSSYWATCPSTPSSTPVNEPWNGQGSDPRTWQNVPSSNAKYTIEVVPQNGYTTCSTTQTQASMINTTTGTMQIKATGSSNNVKRAIVATLKRAGFLDYLWFTNYEDGDPLYYGDPQTCATPRDTSPRNNDGFGDPCTEITFVTGDSINGPMHTNDSSLLVSGSPTFGRTSADSIEIAGPSPGYIGSGTPVFNGTVKTNAPILTMPATNSSLLSVPGVSVYCGTTVITLNGTTMSVSYPKDQTNCTSSTQGYTTQSNIPLPSSGVIYVKSGSCGWTYSQPILYNAPSGCGDLYIQGNYSQSLTFASDNDIIVTGSLTNNNNSSVLGLIPHNFVRVFHPVNVSNGSCISTAATGPYGAAGGTHPTAGVITIDAAILALNHSFLVDNYNCGAQIGLLTVNGAIAQWFRGAVGTGNGFGGTGYIKNYTYDDRLKILTPPDFLSPLQADWRVGRMTEVTPAY